MSVATRYAHPPLLFYCRLLSRSIAAPRSGTAGVSGRAAAVREAEATETAPAHPEATAHAEARTEPVPAPVAVIETLQQPVRLLSTELPVGDGLLDGGPAGLQVRRLYGIPDGLQIDTGFVRQI